MNKHLVLFAILVFSIVSCSDDKFNIRWKVPSEDVLIYKIQMETIDSLSSVSEEDMGALVKMVAKMYGDSIEVPINSEDIYQGLVSTINSLSYFSILRQGADNELKIDFITRMNKMYAKEKYMDIFNKFIKKAVFKGSLSKNGELFREDGSEVFDPKINILFELPEKPVSVGDTWALNIKFNEKEKTKENVKDTLNQVKFAELLIEDGDSVAVMEYRMQGPENVGRALSYVGKGKFNLNKGKWTAYTGVLTQKISGVVSMKQVQQVKLSEISVETYKSLIKEAQKVDVLEVDHNKSDYTIEPSDNDEPDDKTTTVKPVTKSIVPCPMVYRVQVLASQQPVKSGAKEFKNCKFQVDQIVLPGQDKFKYKYTVGKECSMDKAKIILADVKKSGFPNAYIIKTSSDL